MQDLYDTLQLDKRMRKKITQRDIRMAYLNLARLYHPDKCGLARDFLAVKKAYEVLYDPFLRKQYDDTLEEDEDWVTQLLEKYPYIRSVCPMQWKEEWEPDVFVSLRIKKCDLGSFHQISYHRRIHHIRGLAILTFRETREDLSVYMPTEYDYDEDFLVVQGYGNDIVRGDTLFRGDLNIDVEFI